MYYSLTDNGSDLQAGLITNLRDSLPSHDVAAADRLRLNELSLNNNCA